MCAKFIIRKLITSWHYLSYLYHVYLFVVKQYVKYMRVLAYLKYLLLKELFVTKLPGSEYWLHHHLFLLNIIASLIFLWVMSVMELSRFSGGEP